MAIAGRVAIVPKGEWSQDVTYDKLDLVTYNGNTFIAYKSSVGVEPVDGDTWMLVMQGIDPQDIENIIDGTTPVGDTLKLGGKGASEYALLTALAFGVSGSKSLGSVTSLDELDNYYGVNGYVNVEISGNYQKVIVISGVHNTIQISLSVYYKILKFRWNYYSGDGKMLWSDWNTPATTTDLANYLPLTGGEIYNGSNMIPLAIKGHGQASYVKYLNTLVGLLGHLGFYDKDTPVFVPSDGTKVYNLLHTGNKPSGTYTGTGNTATRSIPTGGIGGCVLITSGNGMILVSGVGAFGRIGSTGLQILTTVSFGSGNINIATDNIAVNASGVTYTYWVL